MDWSIYSQWLPSQRTPHRLVPQVQSSLDEERATVAWNKTEDTFAFNRWAEKQTRYVLKGWLFNKPFSSIVFGQNSHHPLYWSQDSSVDDHWSLLVITIMATKLFQGKKIGIHRNPIKKQNIKTDRLIKTQNNCFTAKYNKILSVWDSYKNISTSP